MKRRLALCRSDCRQRQTEASLASASSMYYLCKSPPALRAKTASKVWLFVDANLERIQSDFRHRKFLCDCIRRFLTDQFGNTFLDKFYVALFKFILGGNEHLASKQGVVVQPDSLAAAPKQPELPTLDLRV